MPEHNGAHTPQGHREGSAHRHGASGPPEQDRNTTHTRATGRAARSDSRADSGASRARADLEKVVDTRTAGGGETATSRSGPVDTHPHSAGARHVHAEKVGGSAEFTRQYWDVRYRDGHSASERTANPHLVAEVTYLAPGTALDAGCGEGAEAIWLASRGWDVTAVDIAAAAVDRGRDNARRAGSAIADRIDWVTADLTKWAAGSDRFDLVCACYVHPVDSNDTLFERLAAAVAPGGILFLVTHAPGDHHSAAHTTAAHVHVTTHQIAAALDPAKWTIELADTRIRSVTHPDGHELTLHDSILRARKH